MNRGSLILKWDITYNCFLRCLHCYNSDTVKSSKEYKQNFTDLSFEKIISILEKCAEGPVTAINFLGGEPFIRKDMPDIIRHGKELGLEMSSNTNGILLKPKIVESIVKAGIDMLVISIDGPNEKTHDMVRGKNTFRRLMNNLNYIKKVSDSEQTNLKITINTILSENNRDSIEDMFQFIIDLKPFKWNLIGFQNEGVVVEQVKKLVIELPEKMQMYIRIGELYQNYLKKTGIYLGNKFLFPLVWQYLIQFHGLVLPFPKITCGAGTSLGFIDPNGNLFPCDRMTDIHPASNNWEFDLSNNSLLQHDFHEVWNREMYNDLFKIIHDSTTYEGFNPCSMCQYRKLKLCFPCPLYKFSRTGVNWNDCQYVYSDLCKNKPQCDTHEFHKKYADIDTTILC